MEVTFLGTASCFPTPDRGVSCIALQKDGLVWLFDCGEGSQIQLQRSKVKPGKIRKIFITHLHGDHLFGLPGLLCTIGQSGPVSHCIEIYGPKGLREYVRLSLQLSHSMLGYRYVVHELDVEKQEQDESKHVENVPSCGLKTNTDVECHPDEALGNDINVNPDNASGLICQDYSCSIFAAPLVHRVPCVGYVIQENDLPGKLDIAKLKARGLSPGPICSRLKNGETVTLPNGECIKPEDVVGPARLGRKVVILGDTQDSDAIIPLAMSADVLVHEATYENALEEKAKEHGHSTAGMAGSFASSIRAKKLFLTHFSQRYRIPSNAEASDLNSNETTDILVKEAEAVFQGQLVAAQDLCSYSIELPQT